MKATFSAVAYLKDGKTPTIIHVPENGRTMPSLVTIDEHGAVTVGKEAAKVHGKQPYRNVKRVIGTGGKLSAPTIKVVPFLRPSSTELIRPETISSHILRKLKEAAEAHTGCHVTRAVIGVPAYFHDEQREATKYAAELAGIKRVKLLREPEAAALAYGIGKQQIGQNPEGGKPGANWDDDDELVLVFDLGGGTFDVSMLSVGGGLTEIICTSGNARLGGSDFDARLADHFRRLLAKHGSSTENWSETSVSLIFQAAERARIRVSNSKRINLALPMAQQGWLEMKSPDDIFMTTSDHPNISASAVSTNSSHLLVSLSRRDVEALCEKELLALLRPVREVAIMAGALLPGDTSPQLLASALDIEEERSNPSLAFEDFYAADIMGGEFKTEELDGDERLLYIQHDETIAAKKVQQRGRQKARDVAKQERKYREEKRKLTKVDSNKNSNPGMGGTNLRDGIAGRPISQVVLVGGATRMPAVGRLVAALTGTIPQKTINPDEAVALGCAIHVGTLDGVDNMGIVLNPFQAAILKAVAAQQADIGLNDG